MAVEILFLSVVLRLEALEMLDPNARAQAMYLFRWQPEWFREDGRLAATTFMCPQDVRTFGAALEARTGLERVRDWVVVDAAFGPDGKPAWSIFGCETVDFLKF